MWCCRFSGSWITSKSQRSHFGALTIGLDVIFFLSSHIIVFCPFLYTESSWLKKKINIVRLVKLSSKWEILKCRIRVFVTKSLRKFFGLFSTEIWALKGRSLKQSLNLEIFLIKITLFKKVLWLNDPCLAGSPIYFLWFPYFLAFLKSHVMTHAHLFSSWEDHGTSHNALHRSNCTGLL